MTPLSPFPVPTVRDELASYDDLIACLLARRNIRTREEAEIFLNPSYDLHLGDPMTMKDMDKASARIAGAIATGERITVWSDYDCDGIPGGVILHDFLKKAKANFTNYIPHRHNEGYGLNKAGLKKLSEEGTTLLITVDSGIVDCDEVSYARELGMDVIVTDHHLPGEALPDAFAVIDLKRSDETYGFNELCGAGVAWKLVCAVLAQGFPGREDIPPGWEKWLLDMVALATIADMVPLRGENRVLVKYGLLVMRKSPRLGLQRLCKNARVEQRTVTEDDVAFMLAPRVNAASRMGDPRDAFELFTATDESAADLLAKKLESVNRSRKAAAGAITRAVHEKLAARVEPLGAVIVLGDPQWRPGLLGLVASGIAEQYERPVFLWGREGSDVLKGSCRGGPQNVHVVELMTEAKEAFLEFGGHAAAGGFSVNLEGALSLEQNLCDALARLPLQENAEEAAADAELTLAEASRALLGKLEKLSPFGMGNVKPAFVFRNVSVSRVSWFGKGEEHVRVTLTHEDTPPLEGLAFYGRRALGKSVEHLTEGRTLSVVATLEQDMFSRGRPVRLRLVSVHI